MSFTGQILATYRDPKGAVRRILSSEPREDKLLAILMVAAAFVFLAQWPAAERLAHFDPSVPLQGRLAGALTATVFLVPLAAYLLAALSHVLSRLAGGRGTFYGARAALFWAMLCVSPLTLLNGLVAGMLGQGPAVLLSGAVVFLAFLWIWLSGLYAAEFGDQT